MTMHIFVVHHFVVLRIHTRSQREVSHPAHWIPDPFVVDGAKTVRQAVVHVATESALARAVLADRVKRLNDVFATVSPPVSTGETMLGLSREIVHVDAEVLSPVLYVHIHGIAPQAALDPSFNVLWVPL